MTETFQISTTAAADSAGSKFYQLFCKAMDLYEAPSSEDNDPDFWKTICAMGAAAWNLSFDEGSAEERIAAFESEYLINALPESFRTVMMSIIEDRRDSFEEESTWIKECRVEKGRLIVVY